MCVCVCVSTIAYNISNVLLRKFVRLTDTVQEQKLMDDRKVDEKLLSFSLIGEQISQQAIVQLIGNPKYLRLYPRRREV
jgi:16S rRNA A1518/A1519 N6-dimethyltransferase RsmA/KsgA/DIM1 with predicted DNA glycosylase/AP lyase activity